MDKTITALQTQKSNPDRLNIFLDGEFAFGVSRFVGAWISVGQVVSEEKIADLVRQDKREKAFQTALNFIRYQPRTTLEVEKRLEKAECSPEIIPDVIAELIEKNYIDDQDFARQWVESRSASKPRSRFLLALELKKKGINAELIAAALDAIPSEHDLAAQFGMQYMRRLSHLDQETFGKRLSAAMQRKGFSYSVIKDVLRDLSNIKLMEKQSED